MRTNVVCVAAADLQHEDSGNYSCEIRGRRSSVLASVVHLVSIRGKPHKQFSLLPGNIKSGWKILSFKDFFSDFRGFRGVMGLIVIATLEMTMS